jgi:3-hydroxymyristoyl/3-hydroxydecanoyl-(acyl carrier protein) dehydratase
VCDNESRESRKDSPTECLFPRFPELIGQSRKGDATILDLYVPETLAFFPGHFPGIPIVPGVVQIMWVMQFAKTTLGIEYEFHHMEAIKFLKAIYPHYSLRLVLRFESSAKKLYFNYRHHQIECSSGRIYFE